MCLIKCTDNVPLWLFLQFTSRNHLLDTYLLITHVKSTKFISFFLHLISRITNALYAAVCVCEDQSLISIANINLSRTKTVPKSGGERNMVGVLPSFLFTIRLHQNPSGSFVED